MQMHPLLQQRRDALGVLSIRTRATREDFAEAERTVIEAARAMSMETKRARLIACENNILIQGPS